MTNIKLEDFIKYKYLSNLQTNPNKQIISFIVSKANTKTNTYNNHLYIYNNKKTYPITKLKDIKYYKWLDNNKIIYIPINTPKNNYIQTTLYIKNITNNKPQTTYTKLPISINHSNLNYRCPIDFALQLFTTLKINYIDTKLIYFKDENHELNRSGKLLNRIKKLKEITNWLNQYCM